jgi:hypothetical protein
VLVYIPATLGTLQRLVADGQLHAANGTAFAVTPTLREAYAHGDEEELADVALRDAALASLRLLAGGGDEPLPKRRAVLVAEVDDSDAKPRPDLDDSVVRLSGPIGIDQVVCAHVDTAAAEPAVEAAIDAIDRADLGDEDAELVVGDAQDHDLAWYGREELPFLIELL